MDRLDEHLNTHLTEASIGIFHICNLFKTSDNFHLIHFNLHVLYPTAISVCHMVAI